MKQNYNNMNKIIEQFNLLNIDEQIYLLDILLEGIKSARELYLDKIGEKDFNRLLNIDPSKNKKYLNWMCKQFIKGADIDRLEHNIKYFAYRVNKGLIKNKDINYYKDIDELDSVLFITPDKSKSEQEKHIKKTQANVILDNNKYFIVEPLTWEASKIYGKGTEWCTASEEGNLHWYNDVADIKARIFYVIDKKLNINVPEYRIAIYVPIYIYYDKDKKIDYNIIPCTLWDAEDRATESNLEEVSNRFGINIDKISNIKYIDFNTKEGIKNWLDYMYIRNYIINDDLTVDVNGDVKLYERNLTEIPIQFGIVKGTFNCRNNNLKSLKGSPNKVGGTFYCNNNQLISLKYAPKEVGWNFDCNGNQLKSLKGSPNKVGRDFDCGDNNLTSLQYAPKELGRDFDCNGNHLKSLRYAPNKVGEDFNCISNKLTKEYLNNFDFSFVKGKLTTDYDDINDKWNKK